MTAILNGIFLIVIGFAGMLTGPQLCERHGEPQLGVAVSVGGAAAVVVGALTLLRACVQRNPAL